MLEGCFRPFARYQRTVRNRRAADCQQRCRVQQWEGDHRSRRRSRCIGGISKENFVILKTNQIFTGSFRFPLPRYFAITGRYNSTADAAAGKHGVSIPFIAGRFSHAAPSPHWMGQSPAPKSLINHSFLVPHGVPSDIPSTPSGQPGGEDITRCEFRDGGA